MADFPSFDENASRPRQAITVADVPVDKNASGAKSAAGLAVEQQWRDVKRLGLDKQHPLSINRDSDKVTSDPYNGG